MMSKKHFNALAAALRQTRDALNRDHQGDSPDHARDVHRAWRMTCRDVANVCAQTNPRFDRARFLAACGMEDS